MKQPKAEVRTAGNARSPLAQKVQASFEIAAKAEPRRSTGVVGRRASLLRHSASLLRRRRPSAVGVPYYQQVSGMSGLRYRYFINDLVASLEDAKYLEVGSWMGSTLCSAVDGNAVTALAVDNWSEFGGPQAAFYFHLGRADLARARVSVLNSDFRSVAWSHIGRYNVYLFDGPHAMQDQYDGLALAAPALEDSFVFIVDDWNWAEVREGTRAAITATGMNSEYEIEVLTSDDNVHPGEKGFATNETSDWHNGYFISVLTKGK